VGEDILDTSLEGDVSWNFGDNVRREDWDERLSCLGGRGRHTEQSDDRVPVTEIGTEISVHTSKSGIPDIKFHPIASHTRTGTELTEDWFDQ
jgi:hypothetical protein